MKKTIFTIITLVSLSAISFSAQANYNVAGKTGDIQCAGEGLASLTISANRKLITLQWEGDQTDQVYQIAQRESDGDTYVSFMATGPLEVVLSLDDRGDSLSVSSTEESVSLSNFSCQ